jgi:hypothetical protein
MGKQQLSLGWKLLPALCIGILLFLVSYLVTSSDNRDELWHGAIKDLGIIIFGIAAVEIVWKMAGGAPIDITLDEIKTVSADMRETTSKSLASLQTANSNILGTSSRIETLVEKMNTIVEAANRTGVINIGANQEEVGFPPGEIARRAHVATRNIELCGTTLYVVYSNDAALNAVLAAAKRGVAVRILLPSPAADEKILVANFKGRFLDDIKSGALSKEIARKIAAGNEQFSSLEVKLLAKKTLTMALVCIDETMIVTPYLYEKQTSESPRFQISGSTSPLFQIYLSEFNALFAIAETMVLPQTKPAQQQLAGSAQPSR